MSGVATPQPSPNEYWANAEAYAIPPKVHSKKEKDLYPIDEVEDFQDPFSELSLFLAKKVKNEIQKRGGVKKWNHQIQTELLKSILPEFKAKFPRYRLGISALRKTWEKITYYQQKISSVKQAIHENGRLNLEYLVKENIRTCHLSHYSNEIHPYNHSQKLAANLSECVATLEGECPKVSQLTKTFWALQKHLLKQPVPKAASPFEDQQPLDKLIIKTMLQEIIKNPTYSRQDLAIQVKKVVSSLLDLPFLSSLEELSSFLSMLVAKKITKTSMLLKELTSSQFNHIKRSTPSKFSSQKPNRLTLVQKILALYPLSFSIPKDVEEKELKKAIEEIYLEKSHSYLSQHPDFDPSLYAFIKTEILLLKEKKGAYSPDKIEKAIVEAYNEICQVPLLGPNSLDQLEIYLWSLIDEIDQKTDTLLDQGFPHVMEEIESVIIDMPHLTFRGLVQTLTQIFKQILQMKNQSEELEDKIYLWTIQNDMVCRFLFFDGQNILFELIKKHYQKDLPHETIILKTLRAYLEKFPKLKICKKKLEIRIWIIYKYFWYHHLLSDVSSFNAFLRFHSHDLKKEPKHERKEKLKKRVETLLPLMPFSEEDLNLAS